MLADGTLKLKEFGLEQLPLDIGLLFNNAGEVALLDERKGSPTAREIVLMAGDV